MRDIESVRGCCAIGARRLRGLVDKLSSKSWPPKVQSQTWKSGLSELLFLVVIA
jgi:hypothetical protein